MLGDLDAPARDLRSRKWSTVEELLVKVITSAPSFLIARSPRGPRLRHRA